MKQLMEINIGKASIIDFSGEVDGKAERIFISLEQNLSHKILNNLFMQYTWRTYVQLTSVLTNDPS
jgi:hypothetical protein